MDDPLKCINLPLQNVLPSSGNSVVKTIGTVANILLVHYKLIPELMKAKNYEYLCSKKPVFNLCYLLKRMRKPGMPFKCYSLVIVYISNLPLQ